jgi:hypothetical protein
MAADPWARAFFDAGRWGVVVAPDNPCCPVCGEPVVPDAGAFVFGGDFYHPSCWDIEQAHPLTREPETTDEP